MSNWGWYRRCCWGNISLLAKISVEDPPQRAHSDDLLVLKWKRVLSVHQTAGFSVYKHTERYLLLMNCKFPGRLEDSSENTRDEKYFNIYWTCVPKKRGRFVEALLFSFISILNKKYSICKKYLWSMIIKMEITVGNQRRWHRLPKYVLSNTSFLLGEQLSNLKVEKVESQLGQQSTGQL